MVQFSLESGSYINAQKKLSWTWLPNIKPMSALTSCFEAETTRVYLASKNPV